MQSSVADAANAINNSIIRALALRLIAQNMGRLADEAERYSSLNG